MSFGKLIYSNSCQFCNNLLTIMDNENMLPFFTIIDINKMATEDITGSGIKQVPCLIIKTGISQKTNLPVYKMEQGKDAFEWIKYTILNRRKNQQTDMEMRRKQIIAQNKDLINKDGYRVIEYNREEMTGISDMYGLIDEKLNEVNNLVGTKCFADLDTIGTSIISVPTEAYDNQKVNESQMKEIIEKINEERQREDNINAYKLKEQQINIINNFKI